jgi:hypothetical protein
MSEMSLGLSAQSYGESRPEAKRYFFDVSVFKLIVMSMVTLSFYQIYWFYQNWRLAKDRGEDVIPLARAIFSVFFAYPLFKEVRHIGRSVSLTVASGAGGLALLYFFLQAAWRLPSPLFLLGFASVLPLAIVQNDIAKIHRALGLDPNINRRFTWKNIVVVLVGGLFLLLALLGLFLPAA